ncbi:hypothetical protein QYE76_004973 [Lolium multiflorum]|uniref:Uncharacterized protein n=1 Tax=Lolium multiflorum TaxID=4521 RepID=A0AAD8RRR2_LOLMU|nr:hypothetical protein QYE76_004973 [Lolium multiflorum]
MGASSRRSCASASPAGAFRRAPCVHLDRWCAAVCGDGDGLQQGNDSVARSGGGHGLARWRRIGGGQRRRQGRGHTHKGTGRRRSGRGGDAARTATTAWRSAREPCMDHGDGEERRGGSRV